MPRVITVDKNPSYPAAVNELKNDRIFPKKVGLRQIKYLNNIIEQDHRPIKRIVRPMLGFQSFHTAIKTLKGIGVFLIFSGFSSISRKPQNFILI